MLLEILMALVGPAAPPAEAKPPAATAALLYRYEVTARPEFEAGYKAHLEWHREHGDHLVWYGWFVLAGDEPGAFVDGTFGSDFAAIDRRPKLAEDGRHFAQSAGPFSRPTAYSAWSLWREASTAFPLERREPTPFVDVYRIVVEPRSVAAFEAAVEDVAARRRHGPGVAWYRGLVGMKGPAFLLLVPRRTWAELEGRGGSLAAIARQAYGASPAEAARLDEFAAAVDSEVWGYRADLSYFPGR